MTYLTESCDMLKVYCPFTSILLQLSGVASADEKAQINSSAVKRIMAVGEQCCIDERAKAKGACDLCDCFNSSNNNYCKLSSRKFG